jgi:hypothetical protein
MQALIQLKDELRQFLIRTQTMLIGSIVIAPFVFIIEFGPLLINMLQTGSGLQENYAGQVTSQYILAFLKDVSTFSASKALVVFIIWAGVGLMAYFALAGLIRWAMSVYNEIVVDTQYSPAKATRLLITHFALKFFVFAGFVLFVGLCVVVLLPYWMDMVRIFIYDMSWVNSSLLLLGILGLTTTIYLLWSFAYLTWVYEETT